MNRLLIATTKDPDMKYILKENLLSPFILLATNKKTYLITNSLEYKRIKEIIEESNNKNEKKKRIEVILDRSVLEKNPNKKGLSDIAARFLQTKKVKKVVVSSRFPVGSYVSLRKKGIGFEIKKELFPERRVKCEEEIERITECGITIKKAFELCYDILNNSYIKNNKLYYKNKVLTSEFLKKEIYYLLFENVCFNEEGIIVSSGEKTHMPHFEGRGEIKANVPIVVDIFSRNLKSGYWFDMTRTFCKGVPNKKIVNMYSAVREAQESSIEDARDGVVCSELYKKCLSILKKSGFNTTKDEGMIHSLGHGVGLEIHETPNVSLNCKEKLKRNNVVAIEPGLYYKGVGGVRIEDVVVIDKCRSRSLINFTKELIIK